MSPVYGHDTGASSGPGLLPGPGEKHHRPAWRRRPAVVDGPKFGSAFNRQGGVPLRDVVARGGFLPAPPAPEGPLGSQGRHRGHFWLARSQPVRDLKQPWMPPELWRILKQRLLSLGDDTATVSAALKDADFWHPYAACGYGGTSWDVLWGIMAASIRDMAMLSPIERRWAGAILAPVGPLLGVEAGWFVLQRISLALQRGVPGERLVARAGQVADCLPLTRMHFPRDLAALEDVHIKRTHLVRDCLATLVEADGAQDAAAAYLLQVVDGAFESLVARIPLPLPLLAEDPADTPQRRLASVILAAGSDGGWVRASHVSNLIVSQADALVEDTAQYIAYWLHRKRPESPK